MKWSLGTDLSAGSPLTWSVDLFGEEAAPKNLVSDTDEKYKKRTQWDDERGRPTPDEYEKKKMRRGGSSRVVTREVFEHPQEQEDMARFGNLLELKEGSRHEAWADDRRWHDVTTMTGLRICRTKK